MSEAIGQITQSFVAGRDASHVVQLAGNHNVVLVVAGESRWLQSVVLAGSPRLPGAMGANPYQSLDAFNETSSDLFFGRSALSGKLMGRLERLARADAGVNAPLRFMAIVGPSGCGKSSIARAGLVPAIAHSGAEALRNAQVLAFRPGRRPLAALAAVLARRSPELLAAEVEAELRRAGAAGRFSDLTEATPFPDRIRRAVILVVDQFEEVYSQSSAAHGEGEAAARAERSIFARTLLAAARAPDSMIFVVLTVRSDFLAAVGEHQDVSAAIAANHELVPPMDRAELTEAIGRPAALRRFPLHQAVIDSLASQALESPSALPLVQLALFRFWKVVADAEDGTSEDAAYRALGDLGGAIATSAREVMAGLPSDDARELAWRVLLRAVQIGNGVRDTRRRVLFSEVLAKGTSLAAVQAAVAPFVQDRLLSTGGDFDGAASDWVEITHESLIQNWDDLRRRLDRERSAEILSRRAQEAAERWRKGEGDLWRGVDLGRLKEHAATRGLTAGEADFLSASKSAERRRRWGAAAAIGLAAVLISGGIGSFVFLDQKRRAERDALLDAESRRIAMLAGDIVLKDPRKAYLIAAQAVPWTDMDQAGLRPEVLEARYVFDEAASQISAHVIPPAPEQRILGVSRTGDILAISREAGSPGAARSSPSMTLSILRFDATAEKLSRRGVVALVGNRAEPAVRASFSPDGTTVLVTDARVGVGPGRATKIMLASDSVRAEGWALGDVPWDEGAGLPQSLRSLPPSAYGNGQVLHTAATADGRAAAAVVFQGGGIWRFRFWAGGWAQDQLLPTPQSDPAKTIDYSADGQVLFGLSTLGSVFLWDLRRPTPELVTLRPAAEPVIGVAIPEGGGRVLVVGPASVSSWPLDEVLDRSRRDLAAERSLYELMPEQVPSCPSRRDLVSYGLLKASAQNAGDLDNVPPQEPTAGRHLCRLVRGMGDR